MPENFLEDIMSRLNAKNIHDLRQVARALGVSHPADGKKERLLDCIAQIARGELDPVGPAVRGARPKSTEYDRKLVMDVLRCREINLSANERDNAFHFELDVASGVEFDPLDFIGEGLLEKLGDKWFIHATGGGTEIEVFVQNKFIDMFSLRQGDVISGKCKRNSPEEVAGLVTLYSVNGIAPENLTERSEFDKLTSSYPSTRLITACGADDITGRIIDLFSPVAKGQRAFIIGPHGAGKTRILKSLASGIKFNSDVKIVIVMIDARPEEATDFCSAFPDADVFTSSFDAGFSGHVRTANLALEYAKRRVENGEDVVLLLDDVIRLVRAYNMNRKQFLSAIDSSAIASMKKYLAAAKNTADSGSLTIIAALGTGDSEDENTAFYALKDLCNMSITLSYELARAYVRPAFDMSGTYAVHEEKILTDRQLKAAVSLRVHDIREIIKIFESYSSEEELINKLSV